MSEVSYSPSPEAMRVGLRQVCICSASTANSLGDWRGFGLATRKQDSFLLELESGVFAFVRPDLGKTTKTVDNGILCVT